jgi:hypothetical protein
MVGDGLQQAGDGFGSRLNSITCASRDFWMALATWKRI